MRGKKGSRGLSPHLSDCRIDGESGRFCKPFKQPLHLLAISLIVYAGKRSVKRMSNGEVLKERMVYPYRRVVQYDSIYEDSPNRECWSLEARCGSSSSGSLAGTSPCPRNLREKLPSQSENTLPDNHNGKARKRSFDAEILHEAVVYFPCQKSLRCGLDAISGVYTRVQVRFGKAPGFGASSQYTPLV